MATFKRYKGRRIRDSKDPDYKRGRWWVEFRMKGRLVFHALPEARTKEEADQAEQKIKRDMFENKYRTGKEIGFATYFDQNYLPWSLLNKASHRDDVGRGKDLKAFFRDTSLRSITTSDCERFKYSALKQQKQRAPKGEVRSGSTVNKIMALLSSVFTRAIVDRVTDLNPCKGIAEEEEGDGRSRSLTPDESSRLNAALVEDLLYMRDAIAVALGTGLRRGELLALKLEHVNLSDDLMYTLAKGQSVEVLPGCLIVPAQGRSKRKYTRTVPLCESARLALVSLIGDRTGPGPVFSKDINGVSDYWLRVGFERACERANLVHGNKKAGGIVFHDLRRTFATRLRAANVHPFDISYLLGHRIDGVTVTYARESISSLRQAVKALDQPWGEVVEFKRRAGERSSF